MNDGPLLAQIWFARGGPHMGQHKARYNTFQIGTCVFCSCNSKYKHQEGEKQEEGHDRLSKIKVGVKKKCSSKYNHEEEAVEEEEEEDEATNKRAREEEERIGDEEDIVPPSKKKTAAEFRKHLDEQMWERRKLDQMQRNLQELRNEVLSLKNENTRLKDIIINQIRPMKSDLAIIAQKTGRTPVEDLDFSSTFGEMHLTPERRPSPEETEPFNESPMVTERFRETPQTAATAETSAKTQIEVIKGSGVFCQAEAWRAARLATSATAMVGSQPEGMGSSWSPLTKLKR
ncbi:uncharacterized protein [Paramormyrops kingsleyae]|uniref:uncharacterized protein n=1 Tax=Paramormyrops kingsleyae TaxID=1676925 RepID=UPI003B96A751